MSEGDILVVGCHVGLTFGRRLVLGIAGRGISTTVGVGTAFMDKAPDSEAPDGWGVIAATTGGSVTTTTSGSDAKERGDGDGDGEDDSFDTGNADGR